MALAYHTELQGSECHIVSRVTWHDHLKCISFYDDTEKLLLPRSACVSTGDSIELVDGTAWVVCKNGKIQILPTYVAHEKLSVGGMNLEFIIKEITEQEEFLAYQALAQFHYRGHTLCGRTARLVIRNFHPMYPKVVGYIELATPFYMNKARATILNAPFQADDISWDSWDMPTARRYINVIVRIARCVVYPEFRGLGVGQLLVRHAAEFARNRWQAAQFKPYFLEISADMLKFVPFAQKAGMFFIGETEGNLKRVAEDMAYLLKNQQRVKAQDIVRKDSFGIVDQQVARMNRAAQLMEREGWNLNDLIMRLEHLSKENALRDFNLFHSIISLPKPTYLQGLVPEADRFVRQRVLKAAPPHTYQPLLLQLEPISEAIQLDSISLTYESRVRRTWQTHAIQQAFGISPDDISHKVVNDLSLQVQPGEIILLTGASGCGKTTLLHLFAEKDMAGLSGSVHWPANYNPGAFTSIRSHKALIELMATKDVRAALDLLGIVGLSDAFVYLKRFEELSNGQKYRAMLAQLIVGEHNVWLADEFCANLDLLTAHVVAHRLQKIARQLRVVLIVASSQPETFIAALCPDHVVHLTTAWEHRIVEGKEFLNTLPNRYTTVKAPTLWMSDTFLPALRSGRKQSTIRKGRLAVARGLLLLVTKTETTAVNVTGFKYTRFDNLAEEDAVRDGFECLADLRSALHQYYPDLRPKSWITIIFFQQLCIS